MARLGRTRDSGRLRLSEAERRQQLLEAATAVFAGRPYDDVWVAAVARAAGVSRALLYHYFPGKRELFTAIIRRETERLARLTEPDPTLAPPQRLRAGIDAYLDYAAEHEAGYRAMHRGAASGDVTIRALVEANLELQSERILGAIGARQRSSPTVRLAVRAWLSFLVTVCLGWLDRREPDRDELRELCVEVLLASLAAAQRSGG